jgi:methyltransferase
MKMRWFNLLCGAVAAERVAELLWSRAHERRQARHGGRLVHEPAYAVMVALHAGTLVAAPLEARLRPRPPSPGTTALALGALAAASALRAWTLATLGDAWSTRVTRFAYGRRPVVTRGPYRYVRHPNYLAVIIELAALPLAGGAPGTALVASLVNAAVLRRRIAVEERELIRDPLWRATVHHQPRLLPRLWRAGSGAARRQKPA